MSWSEPLIAGALARQIFNRQHLVVVDNCNWTGHECDLLVVTRDLRIIDVEVKISRADLKADAAKGKWWHQQAWGYYAEGARPAAQPRQWPPKVWKHYYALPAAIWDDKLFADIQPNSGVLLLRETGRPAIPVAVDVKRRVRANPGADKISAADAVDIARLASLRMWDAYKDLNRVRDDAKRIDAARAPEAIS